MRGIHVSDEQQFIKSEVKDWQSVYTLVDKLTLDIEQLTHGSWALPAVLQLLIALHFFSTDSFQSVIGDVFTVHKLTLSRAVHSHSH